MNDSGLTAAMFVLANALREQTQVQQELAASNRALTEMLAHTIDAVKELTDELNAPVDPQNDDDDINF